MALSKLKYSVIFFIFMALPNITISATNYADWNAPGAFPFVITNGNGTTYASGTTGTVTNPNNGQNVTINLTGEVHSNSEFGGTLTWHNGENPASSYDISGGEYDPIGQDLIAQTGYTDQQYKAHSINFNNPVEGVVVAIWSLGSGANVSKLLFSEDFEILDDTDGLTRSVTPEGYMLTGSTAAFNGTGGAAGIIRFFGTHSSISWITTDPEYWSGFNVALTDQLSVGTGGPTITIDDVAPTMTITAAEVTDGDTSDDATLSLTFTASEATTDFTSADITASNGTISDFNATSATVYTATFTPTVFGATTIDVTSNRFKDTTGNQNTTAAQFNWTFVADSTSPTMTITAAEVTDGDTSDDATLSLTFTASEATTDFTSADITASNGTISDFNATSATVYTATFTPTAEGATSIDVAGSTFTDPAGNNNIAANQFNWTYLSDPTQKMDVVGLILGKEIIAYNFYKSSLRSVNDRLSWLAVNKNIKDKSNHGLTINFENAFLNKLVNSSKEPLTKIEKDEILNLISQVLEDPQKYDQIFKDKALSISNSELKKLLQNYKLHKSLKSVRKSKNLYWWSAGELSFGKKRQSSKSPSLQDERNFITVGVDKELKENSFLGIAISGGQSKMAIGSNGSKLESNNNGVVVYGVKHTRGTPQFEIALGYGDLNFYTNRIDGGSTLSGQRPGKVHFGSFGVRNYYYSKKWHTNYSAFSKLNIGKIKLSKYSEEGGISALSYSDQTISYEELEAGIHLSQDFTWNNLKVQPYGKAEYTHLLSRSETASVNYVDTVKTYNFYAFDAPESSLTLGAGINFTNLYNFQSDISILTTQTENSQIKNSIKFKLHFRF